MRGRAELGGPAILLAAGLGVLADALMRAPGRPGLNIALWAVAGVVGLAVLLRRRSDPAARETRWLVGGALGFAGAFVLRDAGALAAFNLLAAVSLLLMAAGRGATRWASRAQASDLALAGLRVAMLCAAGPLAWGRAAPDRAAPDRAALEPGASEPDASEPGASEPGGRPAARPVGGWTRRARTVARGTVMALPAVLVLGALLMSADPVFAGMIDDAFRIDIEPLAERVVFAAVIAWLTAGYLRAFVVPDDVVFDRLRLPRPAFAAAEVAVALWILNLLFVAFMAVQLRYLFGGSGLVEVTAGLGYAEYARRGFFELVAAAALVVPILLLADWAAAPDTPRARVGLRATALVLVVLLLGVIASAAYRMGLYQEAYGLTELRLYVSVVIVWLTVVLGWLVLTVLRGQRERFAFGAILAGLACIAALHALDPHALIARVNLDRAAAGEEYDGAYLGTLSADAVPTILARLERLPADERLRAARMLEERWGGERPGGWRTWNLGDWRAREALRRYGTLKTDSSGM